MPLEVQVRSGGGAALVILRTSKWTKYAIEGGCYGLMVYIARYLSLSNQKTGQIRADQSF